MYISMCSCMYCGAVIFHVCMYVPVCVYAEVCVGVCVSVCMHICVYMYVSVYIVWVCDMYV